MEMIKGTLPDWARGDGSGYGYGSGDGSGYGSGDGSGDGDGDGYWKLAAESFAKPHKPTGRVAFWKSTKEGTAANGGSCDPVKPGTFHRVDGPLKLCTANALHATYLPHKWKGERLWLVELIGEVQEQDDKLGALERRIICEITDYKP